MSFSYSYENYDSDGTVDQGTLASSYTNALSSYLQTDGADYVAFLSNAVNGLSVDVALALKAAVEAGNFSLSGLFSAAQSKTGEVDGDLITDPTPTLSVTLGDVTYTIDLTDMLGGLATESWDSVTKKLTVTHTREFYSEGTEPEGYQDDWAAPQNDSPTATPITWGVNEFDEYAEANANPVLDTVNLLSTASDPDDDTLSVVEGSVTLANGNPLPSYMSVDYSTGVLSIDTNSAEFDSLYLDDTTNLDITYKITDGVNDPIDNTVDLTITGTADQLNDETTITVVKGDSVADSGSYDLLGFDWSNVQVDVTGYGDYDYNNEGFTVTGDVDATYVGVNDKNTNSDGNGINNYEQSFITVNPTETVDIGWSADGDLDYSVTFASQTDGYAIDDPDASQVDISLSYDYWM